jgi:hypothetical protein
VRKYRLYGEFFRWIPREIVKDLVKGFRLVRRAIRIFREEGFRHAAREILQRIRPKERASN